MKDMPYSKEQLMRANIKLMEQNKRYREAIEVTIHNLKDSDNLGVKFALGILEQALEALEDEE